MRRWTPEGTSTGPRRRPGSSSAIVAEVKCLGVQEVQSPDSDQVKAHYVYRVRVRWDRETACVQPKMRGVWLSAAGEPKWMNIQGCIDADGDRRMLTVTCSAPIA